MIQDDVSLLLASASPRRRQILSRLGLPYSVCISPVDEDAIQKEYQGEITELAEWTATHKALAALTLPEAAHRLVVTADTTVLLDGEVLGKPYDKAHARQLLLSLGGRWHHVVTGVVVCMMVNDKPRLYSRSCDTPVLMRPYSEEEVDAYIATGDPLDKAGAYGIQGLASKFVTRIEGCYFNVVGLPVALVYELLKPFFA